MHYLLPVDFWQIMLSLLIICRMLRFDRHFSDNILCKYVGNCCDDKELRMEYDEIATDTPPPQLIAEHESLLNDGLSVELTASQVSKTAVLPTVSFVSP